MKITIGRILTVILIALVGTVLLYILESRADELRCQEVDGKSVCILVVDIPITQEVVPGISK